MSEFQKSEKKDWSKEVLEAPLQVAEMGRLKDARLMIEELGLEEQLFPLARALDYLLTGDEALIEKLSPEVKGIVEEVVANLRSVVEDAKPVKGEQRNKMRRRRKSKTEQ